jgi:hypothetical protein
MLELAHPATAPRPRSRPQPSRSLAWRVLNVILGLIMLPFGLAMWLIERMVLGISSLHVR